MISRGHKDSNKSKQINTVRARKQTTTRLDKKITFPNRFPGSGFRVIAREDNEVTKSCCSEAELWEKQLKKF